MRHGWPRSRTACARSASCQASAWRSWATPARNGCWPTSARNPLGAIVYGIYPTASAEELEYQMIDGGAAVFVAEDQEYVDRILPIADRLPDLRWIVVVDASAMFAYEHPKLKTFDAADGAGRRARCRGAARHSPRDLDPAAPAFIVYTSGTTGHPKGALVSHGKHLAATYNLVEHYPTLAEQAHRTVAYLPLCHILGRDIAVTLPLLSRLVPHFGEDVEDLPQHVLRGRADGAVHGAALPAEVRLAGAGRHRQHVAA